MKTKALVRICGWRVDSSKALGLFSNNVLVEGVLTILIYWIWFPHPRLDRPKIGSFKREEWSVALRSRLDGWGSSRCGVWRERGQVQVVLCRSDGQALNRKADGKPGVGSLGLQWAAARSNGLSWALAWTAGLTGHQWAPTGSNGL